MNGLLPTSNANAQALPPSRSRSTIDVDILVDRSDVGKREEKKRNKNYMLYTVGQRHLAGPITDSKAIGVDELISFSFFLDPRFYLAPSKSLDSLSLSLS